MFRYYLTQDGKETDYVFRLSIIKKAFEGKLVPQDSSGQPAEKLMERIRAAKEKGKSVKVEKAETKAMNQKGKQKIEI